MASGRKEGRKETEIATIAAPHKYSCRDAAANIESPALCVQRLLWSQRIFSL